MQNKVPNSQGAFVLGIVSICLATVCCCFDGSFMGFVLSIIGFILGKQGMKTYHLNPHDYDERSFKKAKAGVTLSVIGFFVSIIVSVLYLYFWYLAITRQLPPEYQEIMNQSLELYGI